MTLSTKPISFDQIFVSILLGALYVTHILCVLRSWSGILKEEYVDHDLMNKTGYKPTHVGSAGISSAPKLPLQGSETHRILLIKGAV